MASIMTNTSAMTALQTLNHTNRQLSITQSRISTGYRVAEAEDNAAYWSIATTMRSDNAALSTVKDALGLGGALLDVAYTGINRVIDVTTEIKNRLVAARQPGIDRQKLQAEISELQNQLSSIADSSVFSGENWLSVDSSAPGFNPTKTILASFSRSAGEVAIGTIAVSLTTSKLIDSADQSGILDKVATTTNGGIDYSILDLDVAGVVDTDADLADLEEMISWVDDGILSMSDAASNLGALKQRTTMQKEFVASLMDAISRGVGTLVDADMNDESTRLQALQVQQQLGIQALSIANQNTQAILSLFRG